MKKAKVSQKGVNMFEKPKNETVRVSEKAADTIVGSSVKLKGNLKSDGDVIIYGYVTGEIKTKGSVKIGPEANIVASVKARNVIIAGAVQGNIEASERLEITESGKVVGDIAANVLAIAPGAVFSGKSQMAESIKEINIEPVVEVDEPAEKTLKEAK